MRAALVALGLALLLAGCGSPSSPDGPTDPKGDDEAALGIPMPGWSVGDYWTYSFDGEPTVYVVASETASDWVLETNSPERAFSDLRDDISRLGPQRKSDLAGSQGSARVEFFRWPLTAGDEWSTTWDQADVIVRVVSTDAVVAQLEARLANATPTDPAVYRYTYDAGIGWFGSLIRYAPDGSELVNLELTDSGHGWKGDLARWDVDVVLDVEGTLGQGPPPGMYEVPLTATDVWVHAVVHCTSGAAQVGTSPSPFVGGLTGQDERGGGAAGEPCPSDEEFLGPAGAPMAPPQGGVSETWGYAIAGAPNAGTYSLEILVRTLTLVPFGS